jgi:hypothetical protein
VQRALQREPDCLASLQCSVTAARRAGAARLVVGTVSALGDVNMLDLKLLEAKTGREVRRVSRPVSGARDLLIEVVRAAAVELIAPERYSGSLLVEVAANGAPAAGAELYLDGKLSGRTPLQQPLADIKPGQHALRVVREGATDVNLFVEVRFDRVAVALVDLATASLLRVGWVSEESARTLLEKAAAPREQGGEPLLLLTPAPPPPRSPLMRIAGWSAVGLGVVSGVVAVAFHARAYATAADLNRREQSLSLAIGDVQSYADIDREVKTARVFYVLGGVFAAGGVAALLYDRHLDRQPAPTVASWRATPLAPLHGAGLALSRSF